MNNDSIPWPRKGDKLFKSNVDWWHNACLNHMDKDLCTYAFCYKLAGDRLVEHIKDTRRDIDALVYPTVFLYRQCIELLLKAIILDGNELLDIPEDFPKHHKIDELWRQCRRITEKVWTDGPSEDLDAVEKCINEFSETDPTSMAFRYPTDKNNNPSLPGLTHINLRNLSEVMEKIFFLLAGIDDGIHAYLDEKRHMEAEERGPF